MHVMPCRLPLRHMPHGSKPRRTLPESKLKLRQQRVKKVLRELMEQLQQQMGKNQQLMELKVIKKKVMIKNLLTKKNNQSNLRI